MQARDVLKLQNIRNTLILNICPLCTFLPWLNTALEPKDFCLYPRDLFYFFREPYQYFYFFFVEYHVLVSISEDTYIVYPNTPFLHYEGVEEPLISLLLIACSVTAHTAAGW